ncbi:MAG: hypothetical protein KBC43_08035 [Bacteroidales bacterium]|nr:hypothetical protein [Bacteroidales bacterium]
MYYDLEKEYFSLKEVSVFSDLKYRQLVVRVKSVKDKLGSSELIYKKSNRWYIHHSLIDQYFQRRRKPIGYKLFGTINCKYPYDIDYWKHIVQHLVKILRGIDSTVRIKYVLERTKRNIIHFHFLTTFDDMKKLKRIIKGDILMGPGNGMNAKIKWIYEVKGLHKYFRKQNKPVLLRQHISLI